MGNEPSNGLKDEEPLDKQDMLIQCCSNVVHASDRGFDTGRILFRAPIYDPGSGF